MNVTSDVFVLVAQRVYNKLFERTPDFEEQDWENLHKETKAAFITVAELLHKFYVRGKQEGLLNILDGELGA